MFNKIGFIADENKREFADESMESANNFIGAEVKKSLVSVYFPKKGSEYTYFNDTFNLKKGDIVYVDGKLEGIMGIVREVKYNFKIKLSDYKKVISAAAFKVSGKFYMSGTEMLTFDRAALPYENARCWYIPPLKEDDEFVSGGPDTEDKSISLSCLCDGGFEPIIAMRGYDYFSAGKISFLELDGEKGRAIAEGSENYEVEFNLKNGEISSLVCTCYCTEKCKHEYAVLLKLKEKLEFIEKHYKEEFDESRYFAVITKTDLLTFNVMYKDKGSIML